MPLLATTALIIVAITCVSVGVSDWFSRRALGSDRPNSYEDVAILERAKTGEAPQHGTPEPRHP